MPELPCVRGHLQGSPGAQRAQHAQHAHLGSPRCGEALGCWQEGTGVLRVCSMAAEAAERPCWAQPGAGAALGTGMAAWQWHLVPAQVGIHLNGCLQPQHLCRDGSPYLPSGCALRDTFSEGLGPAY